MITASAAETRVNPYNPTLCMVPVPPDVGSAVGVGYVVVPGIGVEVGDVGDVGVGVGEGAQRTHSSVDPGDPAISLRFK